MSDDSFREIQLNGKQLVFLFMAATVVFVVIFLCGVLVGRGVRPEGLMAGAESAPAGAIADSGAKPTEPATDPAPAVSEEPPTPAEGNLTYHERLESEGTSKETLKSASAKPAPPAATPAPAKAAKDAAPKAATGSAVASEPAGAGFAVQIAAMSERTEAENMVRRLTGKGYSAYVMAPQSGGAGVYRVRVGKFKTRGEAETVATRLEKEEQFKPWIIR